MNKNKIIILSMLLMGLALFINMDEAAADSSVIYVNATGGNDNWDGQSQFWVNGTTTGPKKTINSGTTAVTANGTVNIADGTYSGTGNREITLTKNMTIQGQSQNNTIIDGSGSRQIFVINSGVNVTMLNLTIQNARPSNTNGGAIQNNGGTLTVNNCKFSGNSARRTTFLSNTPIYGGAIYNTGNLNIINSIFLNNYVEKGTFASASAYGGAIYSNGQLTISNTIFDGNYARNRGGAIFNDGFLSISGSSFNNNYLSTSGQDYNGGAIFNSNQGSMTLTGSTFNNNQASAGGAIFTFNNSTITGCTFTGNNADSGYGGGALAWGNTNTPATGTLNVNNSSFTSNRAGYGGAVWSHGILNVIGSTFTGNNATYNGGAISSTNTMNILNSIFSNNIASNTNTNVQGGAIHTTGAITIGDSIFTNNRALGSGGSNLVVGGAISAQNNIRISGSTFINNSAGTGATEGFGGGALYIGSSTLTVSRVDITESSFINNTAGYGGAIWLNAGSSTNPSSITKSTFHGNSATYGGAIRNWGFLNIIGSDFVSNRASEGAAINNYQGTLNINLNRIIGNSGSVEIFRNAGTINATNNWWGSNSSPASKVSSGVNVATWLVLNINAVPNSIYTGNTSTITADLTRNQNGVYFNPVNGHVPDGIPVTFTGTLGSIGATGTIVNGAMSQTFTAGPKAGTAIITAVVDGVSVSTPVQIRRNEVYVSPDGDDINGDGSPNNPFKTIGVGMATVASGGNLYILNGTYNERNITINKNVTITGQNTASTIIDAQKLGRIFNITAGSNVVITNLTLLNGAVTGNGGAIYNAGNLTISGSDLQNNTASGNGGTIYNTGNTNLSFNRIIGNGNVIVSPSGLVNANYNWWDSNTSPQNKISGNVIANRWIVLQVTSSKNNVSVGETSTITANLNHDNTGAYLDPSIAHVFDGIEIDFQLNDPVLGIVNPTKVLTVNGIATTTFTGINNGVSKITASQEGETQDITVRVGTVNLSITNYPWKSGAYTYNYKQQIVWLVQVNNLGTSTATGINVKFEVGNGFKVVSYNLITPGTLTFDEATNTFTWIIDRLDGGSGTASGSFAGFSVLLESLKPGSGGADFRLNSTIVNCDQNNVGATKSRVRNLIISNAADIGVNQTVSNFNPQNGDYVTIIVKVKNNGPNDANSVSITDLLPSALVVDSDPNTSIVVSQGDYNPITGLWYIGDLNNGSEATLTFIARVNASSGTTFANRAFKSSSGLYDWNTGNDSDEKYILIK